MHPFSCYLLNLFLYTANPKSSELTSPDPLPILSNHFLDLIAVVDCMNRPVPSFDISGGFSVQPSRSQRRVDPDYGVRTDLVYCGRRMG